MAKPEKTQDTIAVSDVRKLFQITHQLGMYITYEEYAKIMTIYANATDRMLKEQEEENET